MSLATSSVTRTCLGVDFELGLTGWVCGRVNSVEEALVLVSVLSDDAQDGRAGRRALRDVRRIRRPAELRTIVVNVPNTDVDLSTNHATD